jgi:membrane associated rhomboid family serine protease
VLIPLGTDRSLKRPTVTTYWLIGVNVALFLMQGLLQATAPEAAERWTERLWLDPSAPTLWGFVTYQFVHSGLLHILGNMVFLFVFGPNVEDRLGRAWFLLYYLVGGAVAGGAHMLFEPAVVVEGFAPFRPPVDGASGAIAGVTGAYLVLFPLTRVSVFLIIGLIGRFEIPAVWLIGSAFVKDLFFHGLGVDNGVALAAHLGGYVYGAVVAMALLWTKVLAREPFDLFSMSKHAHRRRQFKELTSKTGSPWRHESAKAKVARTEGLQGEDEGLAALRGEISRLHSSGDLEGAGARYLELLGRSTNASLHHTAQLDLANHFFATGKHVASAEAYEVFLKRYGGDGQAAHVRLMLALLNARYLNDPVRSKALLADLRSAGLSDDHAELAQTLERELG